MILEIGSNLFGKNLRYLRKKRRISQKALAQMVGINCYTLRGIESGRICPVLELETFIRICDLFGADHDDMVHQDFSEPLQ